MITLMQTGPQDMVCTYLSPAGKENKYMILLYDEKAVTLLTYYLKSCEAKAAVLADRENMHVCTKAAAYRGRTVSQSGFSPWV